MVFLVLSHGKTIHVGRINLEPYLPLDDVQIVVVHLAKGILLLCFGQQFKLTKETGNERKEMLRKVD